MESLQTALHSDDDDDDGPRVSRRLPPRSWTQWVRRNTTPTTVLYLVRVVAEICLAIVGLAVALSFRGDHTTTAHIARDAETVARTSTVQVVVMTEIHVQLAELLAVARQSLPRNCTTTAMVLPH